MTIESIFGTLIITAVKMNGSEPTWTKKSTSSNLKHLQSAEQNVPNLRFLKEARSLTENVTISEKNHLNRLIDKVLLSLFRPR